MNNLKKLVYITLASMLITGCDSSLEERINLENYSCSVEQLKAVEIEFNICNQSSYISSHCFAQAKKTHCELISGIRKLENKQ